MTLLQRRGLRRFSSAPPKTTARPLHRRRPATQDRYFPLREISVRWFRYGSPKTLANHQRLPRPLRGGVRDWGERLARVSLAQGWVPVFLTATWPEAPSPVDSYRLCGELREALLSGLPPLGTVYYQDVLEVHRLLVWGPEEGDVVPPDGFDGLSEEDETPSPLPSGRRRSKAPLPPTSLREENRAKEGLVSDGRLLGHGHLHALLLLPPEGLERLERLLWPWLDQLDRRLSLVGGTRELERERRRLVTSSSSSPSTAAVTTLGGHLAKVIGYLTKDASIQAKEQLPEQLAQGGLSVGAKFTLAFTPSLATLGGQGTTTGPLPLLTATLPSLEEILWRGEPLTFPPYVTGSTDRLSWLLATYLEQRDGRLRQENRARPSSPPIYRSTILVPSPLHLQGALTIVATGADEIHRELVQFYKDHASELLDFLDGRERQLARKLEGGGLVLPPRRLLTTPLGPYAVFTDGTTLHWGGDSLLAHSADEFATLVAPVKGPFAAYALTLSTPQLLAAAVNDEAIPQIHRILHRSDLSPAANRARVVLFLRQLGRCLRSKHRDKLAFLFHGRGGSGKTPLLKALLSIFGRSGSLDLSPKRGDFFLEQLQDVSGVLVDEVLEDHSLALINDLLSRNRRPVQRKGVVTVDENFSTRVFAFGTNLEPEQLVHPASAGWSAFAKRVPLRFRLKARRASPKNPHGFHPSELRREVWAWCVYGLYYSSPAFQRVLDQELEWEEGRLSAAVEDRFRQDISTILGSVRLPPSSPPPQFLPPSTIQPDSDSDSEAEGLVLPPLPASRRHWEDLWRGRSSRGRREGVIGSGEKPVIATGDTSSDDGEDSDGGGYRYS